MKPIVFTCEATLALSAEEIGAQILDVARWPDFRGRWPIPGIASAAFETRTERIVGSRIRVLNTDGSAHVEEIVEWSLPRRITLQMDEFSPPLSRLATRFIETWTIQRRDERTHVARKFEMFPKSRAARPLLWAISFLLKRAVMRHLGQIAHTTTSLRTS